LALRISTDIERIAARMRRCDFYEALLVGQNSTWRGAGDIAEAGMTVENDGQDGSEPPLGMLG